MYRGFFVNGKFHGKGTLIFENGDMFDGRYINGLPHGDGTFLHKSVNIFENKTLSNGLDRVNSGEFNSKTFNAKENGKGKAVPISMCHAAIHRKDPNTNIAKDLLGDLFNKSTKRVAKNTMLKKRPLKNLSRSRSRSVRNPIKVTKCAKLRRNKRPIYEIDFEKKFCTNKKFELTNRGQKKMIDLTDVFQSDSEDQEFSFKRTKTMEFTIKSAKEFLSKSNKIIIE